MQKHIFLDTRLNTTFPAVNELLKQSVPVYRSKEPVLVEGSDFPAGSFIVENVSSTLMNNLANKYHLDIWPIL